MKSEDSENESNICEISRNLIAEKLDNLIAM